MLKELLKEVGMNSPDERVYKVMSIMMEAKLIAILDEVYAM